MAKAEIYAIVAERTKTLTVRVGPVDADYYPFIAAEVAALEAGKDIKVRVPPAHGADAVAPITVAGEREAALEAKAKIEALAAELKLSLGSAKTTVPKRQHRYIVGEKGRTVAEIFESTGCVLKIPPAADASEEIEVVGPRARIGEAISLALTKANSIVIDSLDIARAHGKNRAHAADLTRFFTAAKKLGAVEKKHDVQVAVPAAAALADAAGHPAVTYDIAGKTAEAVKAARKDIVDLVSAYPPHRVARLAGVDALLHRYLVGAKGRNIQKVKEQHGVETVMPDGDGDILLVYEGVADDEFPPDAAEIAAVLAAARQFYDDIRAKQADLVTRVLTIPAKQHKYIVGPKHSTLNAITGGPESPIYVQLGVNKDRAAQNAADKITDDSVVVRGPAADVDRVAREILAIVDEAANNEVLNSYTVEFEFPTKFASVLIGKAGANISKYRDELGVKIDLDEDGKVTIKGIKKNVVEAEARIKTLKQRLEDEVTLRIKVPSEYHGALIGQKGKFAKRLEEKYNVRVMFPQSGEDDGDERAPQGKDEIVVRGPSKPAAQARDELVDLYQYEVDHGHSKTIDVPRKALSRVIGRSGEFINGVMDATGAKIDIEREGVAADAPAVPVVVSGTTESIAAAEARILAVIADVEQFATRTVAVDKKYHKALIGNRGAGLRDIAAKAGGPEDPALLRRTIRVPPVGADDDTVVVQGNRELVDRIVAEIAARVAALADQVTAALDVPHEFHRFIIGPGGSVKRGIETDCAVVVTVPQPKTSAEITVAGAADAVAAAEAKIRDIVARRQAIAARPKKPKQPPADAPLGRIDDE
ncbi:uncharacterized protein V1510DRAFT_413990 [Dipodascopsis tothii]|uniref:uncharacterized protein n=1 Tax=Dipodascopsis tothii TaxID=44089 RepID=UPI0034CF2772